mmetsp:Transcript_35836/g.65074  ORF Transcript_35836/g.65074 Transcript_35836/m.65074 type:complete len:498 (-) Transcript_35836:18-1511(-)
MPPVARPTMGDASRRGGCVRLTAGVTRTRPASSSEEGYSSEAQVQASDIPSESMLQVPVQSSLPMPSRPSLIAPEMIRALPVNPRHMQINGGGIEAIQSQTASSLVHRPRSHVLFAGASQGSVVNLPRRSEAQRRPPREMAQISNPPELFQRRQHLGVSARPVCVPPIVPQGDGACGWSEGGSSRGSSVSSRSGQSRHRQPEAAQSPDTPEAAQPADEEMPTLASQDRSTPLLSSAGSAATEMDVASALPGTETHAAMTERTTSRASVPSEDLPQVAGARARSVPPPERERMARLLYPPQGWQAPMVHVETASGVADGDVDAMMPAVTADEEEQRRLSHHMSAPELPSTWQVAEELGHSGGMAAPRYLLVRLGECIPAETGAAPVHRSRLDSGPQWRDFLNFAEGGSEGVALEEVLTCPCCLCIFRQPIGLPCGHSLCRGCYVRVSSQPNGARRCPLCRADLPRCDLKVNVALAAVSDTLRAFQAVKRPRASHWQIT